MSTRSYFTLHADPDEKYCVVLDFPEDFKSYSFPARGMRMDDRYSPGTVFSMGREAPGIVVPDFVPNAIQYLMVSERAKDLVLRLAGVPIEPLNFVLRDHKGRLRPEALYILNVLTAIDCVDRTRTQGRPDSADPSLYFELRRVQIDPARVPEDVALFRLKAMPALMIVRDDLRDAILAAGLTGVRFSALGTPIKA